MRKGERYDGLVMSALSRHTYKHARDHGPDFFANGEAERKQRRAAIRHPAAGTRLGGSLDPRVRPLRLFGSVGWYGTISCAIKKIVERSHCPLLFSSSSVHFQPPQLDLHDLRSASPSYAPDHDHHHHDGPPKTSIHPVGDSHSRGSFSRLLELADGYSAWRHRNQGCSGASRH